VGYRDRKPRRIIHTGLTARRVRSIHVGSAADLRDPPGAGRTERPQSLRRRRLSPPRAICLPENPSPPPASDVTGLVCRPTDKIPRFRRGLGGVIEPGTAALLDIHCYYGDTVRRARR